MCLWRISNFQFPIFNSQIARLPIVLMCSPLWFRLCLWLCAGRMCGMCRQGCETWLLATVDSRDATDDSAQRERTFIVCEEKFADAAAAVVPALQDRQMLHQFQRSFCICRRKSGERFLYSRFHGLGFGMFS